MPFLNFVSAIYSFVISWTSKVDLQPRDNKAVLKLPKEDGKFKNHDFDESNIKGILEKHRDTIISILKRYN